MNHQELRYRIYGDDRLSGKLNRISGAGRKTDRVLNSVSNKMKGLKTNIRGAAAEIPGLSGGLRLLTNPFTLAAGGAALLATGINSAANEAAQFNTTFREVKNLNLDKTSKQINSLRSDVLGLSAIKGFNPFETSKAFYDIQSVTGKYGYDVKQIVSKQGEFADVFQANFNSWIEGTGKAMANYGFGTDKLDAFNRSAYATVNVGSITFDELSRLQAVYAGSAAAAKQSFNSANQLMTLFTVKTEKANESATNTKSAFIDLFKASTVKAFHSAGIKMYDDLTGNARQVKDIMIDLNKEFMKSGSHKELNELRDKFKGSEGLNMLIQTAADTSGGFLRTLELFNKVDFNYGKALKEANEDVTRLQKKTENLLMTSKIQLGQEMLPRKLEWVKFRLEFMKKANALLKGRAGVLGDLNRDESGSIRASYKEKLGRAHIMTPEEFDANQSELVTKYQESLKTRDLYQGRDAFKKYAEVTGTPLISAKSGLKEHRDRWQNVADTYMTLIKQFPEYMASPVLNPYKTTEEATNSGSTDDNIAKGLNAISGGGFHVKNVTVSINKLVEQLIIQSTTLSEAEPEIEEKVTETLVRAIAGAEQIVG